jgi:hypothetical protein
MEDVGKLYGHLVYFWTFGMFCGYLVYFEVIWLIFSRFGILYQEKSGNPGAYGSSCCPACDRKQ